jgi:serine/threonine protein kinase
MFLRQIAAAFEHIRDKRIIHRDMKQANVLLLYDMSANVHNPADIVLKIADFGLARQVASQRNPAVRRSRDYCWAI